MLLPEGRRWTSTSVMRASGPAVSLGLLLTLARPNPSCRIRPRWNPTGSCSPNLHHPSPQAAGATSCRSDQSSYASDNIGTVDEGTSTTGQHRASVATFTDQRFVSSLFEYLDHHRGRGVRRILQQDANPAIAAVRPPRGRSAFAVALADVHA